MTWSLRGDPDAVATLAARIEDATAIPSAHVEKDFWVTEVLRGVAHESAETGVSAVFKGGTSLSKAYRLIARFSEDVDVIVITPGGQYQQRRSVLETLRCFRGGRHRPRRGGGPEHCNKGP